ncbi:hypothetical protein C7H19_25170 [Aphanothece hegewaldii CCALA 016]|uniref:Calcium-binding protein n=1 Tax=Aphanothece hegewaldii CCALA 016 TaxID=2107694 RepID=A0A2T1LQ94_9CHRO|nr:calcium-binding protein [Aphanothece hegewaldii]PSF25954.1 hypothetical protein C7H19_25170 [Aphanothece hegewaldii CCALA 016]
MGSLLRIWYDTLVGGLGNDSISSGDGNDSISSGDGDDSISSGDGNDSISSGDGDDTINAGTGNDTIDGGVGNDRLILNFSTQTTDINLTLNTGFVLTGVANVSNIESYNITSGSGNDSIIQSGLINSAVYRGTDTINGGAGNDTLNAGLGDDNVSGGAGDDLLIIDYSVGDTGKGMYLSTYSYTEGSYSGQAYRQNSNNTSNLDYISFDGINRLQVTGTSKNDTLTSGLNNDTIDGGAGNDNIDGDAGNDSLVGGDGDDTINAGTGNDTIDGGVGNDRLILNLSTQTTNLNLTLNTGFVLTGIANVSNIESYNITSGSGNDSIIQSGLINSAVYRANDTINGGTGNDTLNAGLGDDNVSGGAGDDLLIIDYSVGDTGKGMYLSTYSYTEGSYSGQAYRQNSNNTSNLDYISFDGINRLQVIPNP